MKKFGFYLVAIAVILVGLLVGTLNSTPVSLDLLWVQLGLPLGLAVLLGFAVGIVTGLLLLYLARVLPMKIQLRKARAVQTKQESQELNRQDD